MPRLLYLLALCNLVIGTGAFIINGIVEPIAASLGVSIAAAGQAMSAYALSTALLAPLALVATGRWPRKRALVAGLLLFALGGAVCAFADNLALLLCGRVLMGMGAMFTPLAAGIAVALTTPAERGRALSLVFLGMSLSYVIGVPLGAWLGFRYGWHTPVALVAVVALASAGLVAWWCPRTIVAPGATFAGLGSVLANPPVAWALALTLLYFVAIFTVFSFIGPVLQALVPMSPERLSLTLMAFGLGGVAGTISGGWAADRYGAPRTLKVQLALLAAMMLLLPLTQGRYAALLAVLCVWSVAGFGMMAPQQSRLAQLAPAQAPMLLSLNTSMLYLGTALGAAVGGVAAAQIGFAPLSWVAAAFALAGMAALRISTRETVHLETSPANRPG